LDISVLLGAYYTVIINNSWKMASHVKVGKSGYRRTVLDIADYEHMTSYNYFGMGPKYLVSGTF